MRLKDYARNYKKRKDYVQQPGLLMMGVDVSRVEQGLYGHQGRHHLQEAGFPYCYNKR